MFKSLSGQNYICVKVCYICLTIFPLCFLDAQTLYCSGGDPKVITHLQNGGFYSDKFYLNNTINFVLLFFRAQLGITILIKPLGLLASLHGKLPQRVLEI